MRQPENHTGNPGWQEDRRSIDRQQEDRSRCDLMFGACILVNRQRVKNFKMSALAKSSTLFPSSLYSHLRVFSTLPPVHVNAYQYLERSIVPSMHFQKSLPRLPVPKLEKTFERYLSAVKPIFDHDQYERAKRLTKAFENGAAKELHETLVNNDKLNKDTSYITEPWFDMYLTSRTPIPINCNPYMAWIPDLNSKYDDELSRATNLVISACRHFRLQYMSLSNSIRIPVAGKDQLRRYPNARHVLVLRKGHFFAVDGLDKKQKVAFFRQYQKRAPTYESCSTAASKRGRTETVRSATSETKKFTDALLSKNRPSASELRGLLEECSKKHSELTKEAAMGQGFDRHLFAMRHLAESRGGPIPEFCGDVPPGGGGGQQPPPPPPPPANPPVEEVFEVVNPPPEPPPELTMLTQQERHIVDDDDDE